jgi:serine/threonine protein phosphatase PrpC
MLLINVLLLLLFPKVEMVVEVLDKNEGSPFQGAAERLAQEAYVRGSSDNIGVCVVAIE